MTPPMLTTDSCDHGNPPDGSCTICLGRSKAMIDDIIELFEKHDIPRERRWTMLLGQAVGGLLAAGVSAVEISAEAERICHVVAGLGELDDILSSALYGEE